MKHFKQKGTFDFGSAGIRVFRVMGSKVYEDHCKIPRSTGSWRGPETWSPKQPGRYKSADELLVFRSHPLGILRAWALGLRVKNSSLTSPHMLPFDPQKAEVPARHGAKRRSPSPGNVPTLSKSHAVPARNGARSRRGASPPSPKSLGEGSEHAA